jgi:hypothetical protein
VVVCSGRWQHLNSSGGPPLTPSGIPAPQGMPPLGEGDIAQWEFFAAEREYAPVVWLVTVGSSWRRSELRVVVTTQALCNRFFTQLEHTARSAVGDSVELHARPVVSACGTGQFGSSKRRSEAAPTTRLLRKVRRPFHGGRALDVLVPQWGDGPSM